MICRQFGLYLVVGGFNTMSSYVMYAALLWLGLAFQWANFLAMTASIGVSYLTQSRFVFSNSDARKVGSYALLWLGMYLCNIALIWMFKQAGMDDYMAGLVAMIPIVLLSFILQKFIIFRTGQPS